MIRRPASRFKKQIARFTILRRLGLGNQIPAEWRTETCLVNALGETKRNRAVRCVISSNPLWVTNLATNSPNGTGAVPCTEFLPNCNANSFIYPVVGVTGTPVIDTANHILYVVSTVLTIATTPNNIEVTLHAIDLATGHEKPNSPSIITAWKHSGV